MATYRVRGPDGNIHRIEGPDDATPKQVEEFAANSIKTDNIPLPFKATIGMGEAALNMGTGLAGTAIGGLGGLYNLIKGTGDPSQIIRETQGAFTYKPRTEYGQAISRALGVPGELYSSAVHKAGDVVRGGDSGGVRDFLGTTVDVLGESAPVLLGGAAAARNAMKQRPLTVKQETLKKAQGAGYAASPADAGRMSVLEGMTGKPYSQQRISVFNDANTARLMRQELGLPKDAPLTVSTMQSVRDAAYKSGYEPLKKSGLQINGIDRAFINDVTDMTRIPNRIRQNFPDAKLVASSEKIQNLRNSIIEPKWDIDAGMEYIRHLRAEATQNLKPLAQADPDRYALGHAQRAAADALEGLIERQAPRNLVSDFRAARTKIAKTHSIEDAMNDAAGTVSARELAKLKDRGIPLTGNLKTAADFAEAFPKSNQNPATFGGSVPWTRVDALTAMLAGGGGAAAFGAPGAALAALPLARPLMAPLVRSSAVQSGLLSTAPTGGYAAASLPALMFNPLLEQ